MAPAPSIGRIVHAIVSPLPGDEEYIAPAIITRVFPEDEHPGWLVNYTVIPNALSMVHAASGRVYADETEARKALESSEEMAAFWPPTTGGPITQPAAEPDPVDPRARLVELAVTIEGTAQDLRFSRPDDAAVLFGEAASIWEFLALHPAKETVTVVSPRFSTGGTVDAEKLAELARQMQPGRL